MKRHIRKLNSLFIATTLLISSAISTVYATEQAIVTSASKVEEKIAPVAGPAGYLVDNYKTNTTDNKSVQSNAVISSISGILSLWEPGDSWNNGTMLSESAKLVFDANIQKCVEITNNRTEEEGINAYLTDRRNQNYSALKGLGIYEETFKTLANVGTTIPDEIPADALTVKYSDGGNENGKWADTDSNVGSIVQLVNTFRGSNASSNPSKYFFQYMRPFRWSTDVSVYPSLIPCIGEDPEKDGGFPSGHTNAGYLASLALAYSVPERFQECLTNASSIGNSRIVAGMHSPLDVIGGRIMATALAAATLNDPENAELKEAALKQGKILTLSTSTTNAQDSYTNYSQNKEDYEARLTYGLPQTGDTTKPMVVPKGAEVLLETRFPYLDAEQRRWILYSTGIESGYEFLDDTEGWGRLNLFAASDGYGAFDTDVTVNMDSTKGVFSAEDAWKNDISGEGSLTKDGNGKLILTGNNTYSGGTTILDGNITLAGPTSSGVGTVNVKNGVLEEKVAGSIKIQNNYTQEKDGCLVLNVSGLSDIFVINGTANLDGKLKVNVSSFDIPTDELQVLKADKINGNFNNIEVTGLSSDYEVVSNDKGVFIKIK